MRSVCTFGIALAAVMAAMTSTAFAQQKFVTIGTGGNRCLLCCRRCHLPARQ